MNLSQFDLFTKPAGTPPADVPVDRLLREMPGPIAGAFERMEIAEEEMERAGISRTPRDCFRHLCPPEAMQGMADWMYRAHARELCQRAAKNGDLRPGTLAEVVCALHHVSLKSPLKHDAGGLQTRSFLAVLDLVGKPAPKWLVDDWREPYEGAHNEMLTETRHATRQEGRR